MKILRAVGILALVAGLVIGSAGSAFAQGKADPPGGSSHSPGKPHGLFGEVSDLDDQAETFTLTTRRGEEVSVTATSATKYKVPESPPSDDINTISDGDWVAMNGIWDGDNFCPKKVHVVPGQGLNFHFVGTVTATDGDANTGTITVECKKVADPVTFSVSESTQYRPDGAGFGFITAGNTVTVVASGWDATAGTATAKAIVLHGFVPDTTAPTVISYNPADDAVDVAIDSNLVIVFDEGMAKGTGNILINLSDDTNVQSIDVTSGSVVISQTTVPDDTVTIDLADLTPGTDYYVTMASGVLTDKATPTPNPYAGITDKTVWNFTTISGP